MKRFLWLFIACALAVLCSCDRTAAVTAPSECAPTHEQEATKAEEIPTEPATEGQTEPAAEPSTEPPIIHIEPVTTPTEPTSADQPTQQYYQPTQQTAEEYIPEPPLPQGGERVGTSAAGYDIVKVNGVTYVGGVMIANKTYSLPQDYDPGALTYETSAAFDAMQRAAAADGITLYIISGFRSYQLQQSVYSNYCASEGQELADTFSARPGHSEHQTGLAMDVNSLYKVFAQSAEGIWLSEHCHEYGFIIRYPEDKVGITGYMFEPWHIRFLGRDLAQRVHDSGLCLEEYLGITSIYE